MTKTTVLAYQAWPTNADLIASVAEAGYLHKDWRTLDPMWGLGNFWTKWKPRKLVTHDALTLDGVDARCLPHKANSFAVVVLDPPYKLNGTPDVVVDKRYGVHKPTSMKARHALIRDCITEAARVLEPQGFLLLKCQDQVSSGKVRWQTREFTDHAESLGLELVDRFDMLGYREQPERTRKCKVCKDGFFKVDQLVVACEHCYGTGRTDSPQIHAQRNASQLLCFMGPRW